jgi:flavin-dependent dehydrogenase
MEDTMGREIVVAGAGIAGLTAAITLHRAGRPVRVIERNVASGAQRTADWDAIENWTSGDDLPAQFQRIGIEAGRFRHVGISAFSVLDPYHRRFDVRTARPFFYLVNRGADDGGLERGLQSQAEAMGIPIVFGTTCAPEDADIWAAGTTGRRAMFVSVGMTFRTDHPDWVCALVDPKIAPRAYAYLAIVQGEGTLAVVLTEQRHSGHALLAAATEIFQRESHFTIRDRRGSGGSGVDAVGFWQERPGIVIGEAASFQDFLWGFGIRQALTSGYWAAKCLLDGERWEALARREIHPMIRASLVNRWVYDRLPAAGYARLIAHFAPRADLGERIGRWYRPRLAHRLLWPLVVHGYARPQG